MPLRARICVIVVGLTLGSGAVRADTHPAWFVEPASLSDRAVVAATAERGTQERLSPLPPPPYPGGLCDVAAPGMPGLAGPADSARPVAYDLVGRSVEGRPILAEYWGPARPARVVLVVGQIHGNECSPTLFSDAIRRRPPSNVGIWLIPTLNPDGHAAYRRENANGADLNADGGTFAQPETQALRDFVGRIRPSLTVHVHSPNGFAAAWPAATDSSALAMCRSIADRTAIRCAGSAGSRSDRSRLFLWQGLEPLGETLLVELHAVSDAEVPGARPRPSTRDIPSIRADIDQVLAVVDQ